MAIKYRVHLVESERGWGQERWTEDFDTRGEAMSRIQNVNDQNTLSYVPDWYVAASTEIEIVEV